MPSHAAALSVDESQEDMVFTIERGSSHEFPLILQDIDEVTTIKVTGDISGWLSFGKEGVSAYAIYPSLLSKVHIRINVPEDAELGEYDGDITSEGIVLARVTVRATLELGDAKDYQRISQMDEEVDALRSLVDSLTGTIDNMKSQIESLEEDLSLRTDEIDDCMENTTSLEDEKKDLEEEILRLGESLKDVQNESENLEESNKELNELTGMLIGTQIPGMFVGGLFMGIIIVLLVNNRGLALNKLKSQYMKRIRKEREGHHGEGPEKKFRYKYKVG